MIADADACADGAAPSEMGIGNDEVSDSKILIFSKLLPSL